MKRYINKIALVVVLLLSLIPNVAAQVDLQRSFMVMRSDSQINGVIEGGEWIIRFSDNDTLGNEYAHPVAMNIQSVASIDTTFVPLESVDSVLFQLPDSEMELGIFKFTEEHLKYIVATDSISVVSFRIDCLSKIDLPKVGQKVFCDILHDPLPFGLIGRVESFKVSYDDGWIQMICEPLTLSDIYKKYYKVSITERDEGTIVPASRSLCSLDPKGASLQEYEITKINQEVEQVNSSEKKISSNSQLILKKYYKECGHTINEYAEMLPELVNLTEEELADKFQDWNLVKFTTKEVTLKKEFEGSCGEHFALKEEEGKVVIYKVLADGTMEIYEETEISTEFLPEPDLIQMQSADGIQLYGIENLNKVLEDFE